METGKERTDSLCLVDLNVDDLFPARLVCRVAIRDYWVKMTYNNRDVAIEVYYLPEK